MSYTPKINHYVKWNKGIEGWVYFVCSKYITIESKVFPKDEEDLQHSSIHKNNRLLVLCYEDRWEELQYIGRRENKYSETILSEKNENI